MSLILRRLSHQLQRFTTPLPTSIHHLRLISTRGTQAPPTNPQFAIDYLVKSCGLPSDKAVKASKKIQHLKSPDRPDAVLKFLRQTGIPESAIQTTVFRDSRILCSGVDRTWRPNVEKLKEVGLSLDDISCIIARCPGTFHSNIVPKVDFLLEVLGSVQNLSVVLKTRSYLLTSSLENVIVPNLSVLKDDCGLSHPQIVQLIKLRPTIVTLRTETLKMNIKRAEQLGIARSSRMFVYALVVVSGLNEHILDAKLYNLKRLGLSQDEVTNLVSRCPFLLASSEELIGRKFEFLIKETGLDKLSVIKNPVMLILSLDKRLIPRSLVKKLLESKGFSGAKGKFTSFAFLTDKQFVKKYVLPCEHDIPGLHHAYTDACAGNVAGIKYFKNILG